MTGRRYRRLVVSELSDGRIAIDVARSRVRVTVTGLDATERAELIAARSDDALNACMPRRLSRAIDAAFQDLLLCGGGLQGLRAAVGGRP